MNYWFISDTHFSHNLMAAKRGYSTVAEMNDAIATVWAETVKPGDRVYHLGDVTFRPQLDIPLLAKLPGHKRLIAGNHDTVTAEWFKAFQRVRGSQRFGGSQGQNDGLWLTHVPCHPNHIRGAVNVHGHVHTGCVKIHNGIVQEGYWTPSTPNVNYFNVNWDVVGRLVPADELLAYVTNVDA